MPGDDNPKINQAPIAIVNSAALDADLEAAANETDKAAATATDAAAAADKAAAALEAKRGEVSDDPENPAAKAEIARLLAEAEKTQKTRDEAIGARALAENKLKRYQSAAPVLLTISDKFHATVAATMRANGEDPTDPDAYKKAADKAEAAVSKRKLGELGGKLEKADTLLSEVVAAALKKQQDDNAEGEGDDVPEPGSVPAAEPPDGDPGGTATAKALARVGNAKDWMSGALAMNSSAADDDNENFKDLRNTMEAVFRLMTADGSGGKKTPKSRTGKDAVVMVEKKS